MIATKIICKDCGGNLTKQGRFYVCDYCNAQWSLSQYYDGTEFTYRPVVKKELPCQSHDHRPSEIQVQPIAVKELKPGKTIADEVYRESLNLSHHENIQLIITFLENGEWDTACGRINELLKEDALCPEAGWYGMACQRHAHNDAELVRSFQSFTQADAVKLDQIIQYATPAFAKHILDIVFASGYVGDDATCKLLATTLPYLFSEQLYTPEARQKKLELAFDRVISGKYGNSFLYLLTHALRADQVDCYIHYLQRYTAGCQAPEALKYYAMILAVDPGNLDIHRKLLEANITANTPNNLLLQDFEKLLQYSSMPDHETEAAIAVLIRQPTTTKEKCELMWAIMGYHSAAPEALKAEILQYAALLLNAKLWKDAVDFYGLILSFDGRNSAAYFGLCLANRQAQNADDLICQEAKFLDDPYFQKALAISKVSEDKKFYEYLISLANRQKRKKQEQIRQKKVKKRIITVLSAVAAVFLAALILLIGALGLALGIKAYTNHRKYSENNIQIQITDKAYPNDTATPACHFILSVNVENGSSLDIQKIDGIMRFYNNQDELLYESNVWLSGTLNSGKTNHYELEVQEDASESYVELHATALHQIKITWELTQVVYNNYETKIYDSGKEKTIHKSSRSPTALSAQEQVDKRTEEEIARILSMLENAENDPAIYDETMTNALYQLLMIMGNYYHDGYYGACFEKIYQIATDYAEDRQYPKAYLLYGMLGYYNYKDSTDWANFYAQKIND